MTRSPLVSSACLLSLVACSQDIQPPPVRNLDRPTEVAFTCFGDLVINGGDPEGEEIARARSAQPISSCVQHARGEPPAGQEDVIPPEPYGFVLQPSRGTVAVVNLPSSTVLDSDPLTPGKNSIPVGTLPVGIAADRSSCHMVTANAGSCDLSHLEVNRALDQSEMTTVSRIPITNAAGDVLRAKPRAIVGEPGGGAIGVECPAVPEGIAYVAFPDCNTVAAVEMASGTVIGGVAFDEDGGARITDGNVTCPAQCGSGSLSSLPRGVADAGLVDAGAPDAGPPDAGPPPPPPPQGGPPRPVTLHMEPDGSRLYIGAENSPGITIVELDEQMLPTSLGTIALEGEVGVTRLAVTDVVEMGGELGTLGGSAGNFQFVYAIASDRTVRVADVDRLVECDTQVDPRFLHEERDVAFLSCMPVGDPETPPRRAGARSPGIELPRKGAPLDIAFAEVNAGNAGESSPASMVGYFAFITSSEGFVYVVNVDDDNYPDFEKLGGDMPDPARVYMPLAIAHQLRDFVSDRNEIEPAGCSNPVPERLQYGPRLSQAPNQLISESRVVLEQFHHLPFMRQVGCTDESLGETPVSELSIAAPVDVREAVFPDLAAAKNEQWFFTWEGPLSVDGGGSAVDGPPIRRGSLEDEGGKVRLVDRGGPFCSIGVEPHDIASVIGCDPARADADCGINESCYVHPDSSTVVQNGICIPKDEVDRLSGVCRDFLITRRRYTITETYSDQLVLGERRRALRTTPLDGCESALQCEELWDVERRLADPAHPAEREPLDEGFEPTWACEQDPTRRPGPDRCVMTCESSEDCEAGLACSGGYCVEGVLPPAQCMRAIQRYQLRAGEAFSVVGQRTGFLHGRITDPASGECVADPDAHPLLVGRLPLRPPPCAGDGLTDLTPNPCLTTVEQTEQFVPYEYDPDTMTCTAQPLDLRVRSAPAVRFRNPVFTLHMVDTETRGDQDCRADLAGDLPPLSAVYFGYEMRFEITGGYFPMFVTPIEAAYPITIAPSPDGQLWVLDQGDASSVTRGRIFTMNPGAPLEGFQVFTIL